MLRFIARTAVASVFLASAAPSRADEPPKTVDVSAPAVRREFPAWEVSSTAFKMGLVSTAILSFAEPEVALARASILTPRLHGNVGEAFVNGQLHATGGWKPVTPRTGPQGIDHVWMKFDKSGRPIDMIVGETKFGTSRLGMTKDGRQMSASWISKRLAKLSDYWDAKAKDVAVRHGESKARPYRLRADYLRAAAEGRVSYRSELFRVKIDGNVAKISVRKLGPDGIAIGPERALPPIQITGRPARIVKAELIGEIKNVYPAAGNAEAKRIAEQSYSAAKSVQGALSRKSAALRLAGTTGSILAAGGLVAGGFDAVAQLWAGGSVDWNRTGTMAGLGALSAGSAEAAQLATSQALLRNTAFRARSVALGRSMGILPSRTVSLLPKAAGGIIGALAFSYGGYALGLYDATEANRTAVAGAGGALAGMATYSAMMAAAAAWGTASTGTAISTLSGAAAYNASLAMYGGGAVAAGGGGMTVGAAVVGGVVTVAAVVVTVAVMSGFEAYDAAQERKRIGDTIEVLRTHTGDFPGNPWARPEQAL
jgi:hypothetical protein